MSNSSRQVYSSDPKLNIKCQQCGELMSSCACKPDAEIDLSKIQVVLSIEKAGRSGKTVTVLARLPAAPSFLKNLLSELKTKCGAGGTCGVDAKRGGFIEIQGDHRDNIRPFLSKKGIRAKN